MWSPSQAIRVYYEETVMVCSTLFTVDATLFSEICVLYKPGKSIPVADALSRKHLNETGSTSEAMEARVHLIVSNVPVSDQKSKDTIFSYYTLSEGSSALTGTHTHSRV